MTATLPLVRILVLLLMLVVLMPFLIHLQVRLQRHCAPSGVDVQKYWGFRS